MKITNQHLQVALVQLAMLKFFPQGQAQKAIAIFLEQICGDADRLQWLVAQLVNHVGEWPGPAEVRGLLCTRYRPADGQEANCTLPGYSPADGEAKSASRDVTKLAAPDAQKLLAGIVDDSGEMQRLQAKLNALRAQPKPLVRIIPTPKPVAELTPEAAEALERWRQKWSESA